MECLRPAVYNISIYKSTNISLSINVQASPLERYSNYTNISIQIYHRKWLTFHAGTMGMTIFRFIEIHVYSAILPVLYMYILYRVFQLGIGLNIFYFFSVEQGKSPISSSLEKN